MGSLPKENWLFQVGLGKVCGFKQVQRHLRHDFQRVSYKSFTLASTSLDCFFDVVMSVLFVGCLFLQPCKETLFQIWLYSLNNFCSTNIHIYEIAAEVA